MPKDQVRFEGVTCTSGPRTMETLGPEASLLATELPLQAKENKSYFPF